MNLTNRYGLLLIKIISIFFSSQVIAQNIERSNYTQLFESAANEFGVPVNLLKGIAFEETRWQHLIWDDQDTISSCSGLPRTYGIMGLWDNSYFGYTITKAARLIGKDPEELKFTPQNNIRGAAALLRELFDKNPKFINEESNQIENWCTAIALFSGYPQKEIAYQRAVDIYSLIAKGYDQFGIKIVPESVDINSIKVKIKSLPNERSWNLEYTDATPDYPLAVWNPASTSNYSTTSNSHNFVVIHDVEGSYLSCISWFKNPAAQASAHYVINGKKDNSNDSIAGQVTQMVEERYKAWHVRCWNSYMIGIEHEGYANDPAWYTPELYQSSANLVKYLCDKYSIPKDRNHIIAHSEWQNVNWQNWMYSNYPAIDPTCNTHTDPGRFWKWDSLMAMVVNQDDDVIHGFEYVITPWWDPTISGSTYGVSKNSIFNQTAETKKQGTYAGKLILKDSSQVSNWFVRSYYNYGVNDTLKLGTTGYLRISLKTNNVPQGLKIRLAVDDNASSISEATTWQTVIADGLWHVYEWKIDDPLQWDNFSNGNGQIDGPNTFFDSIQFSCSDPNSGSTEYILYFDNIEKGMQPVNILSINLSVLLEGLYNPAVNRMIPDSITVFIANTTAPFNKVDSARVLLDSLGNASAKFQNSPTGTYYVILKHTNHVETWSKNGGQSLIKGIPASYNFTSTSSQAYGSNLKLIGTKWCLYTGDINQDGAVDLTDLVEIDNDVFSFSVGKRSTDLNGDNIVDLNDLILCDNNSFNFINAITP